MLYSILPQVATTLFMAVCLLNSVGHAQPMARQPGPAPFQHSWTDVNGQSLNALYLGVQNGIVLLRQGRQQIPVPFRQLSSESQKFLFEKFEETGHGYLLPLPVNADGSEPIDNRPSTKVERYRKIADATHVAMLNKIPHPTPQLLDLTNPQEWTDLNGGQLTARFWNVDNDGKINLYQEIRAGTDLLSRKSIPLETLSPESLNRITSLLAADAAKEVFPQGYGSPATPSQQSEDNRVWIDRIGTRFVGKYVRQTLKRQPNREMVVLQNGETEFEFPLVGLTEAEQQAVKAAEQQRQEKQKHDAEEARRKSELAARQQATQNRRQPSSSSRNSSRSSNSNIFRPGPSPSLEFGYEYHCKHCGHRWKGDSPISQCPRCVAEQKRQSNARASQSRSNRSSGSASQSNSNRSKGNIGTWLSFLTGLLGLIGYAVSRQFNR